MDYVIIGGGNMGRAMAVALVETGVCAPERLLVVDPEPACREKLVPLGCALASVADSRVGEASVVVLAVKPQVSGAMMAGLRPFLKSGQVVVSIMAGVAMAKLRDGLRHESLVRAMPNTPAQIGQGMNVYFPAEVVPANDLKRVEALLEACGEVLRVDTEDAIDAATAISGSGPAYVFYVAENWIRAAEALGFDSHQATKLVQQTLLGATELWKRSAMSAATLREQVTSKGGTTAAALEHFNAAAVGEGIREGIGRAYQRAKELSQ
ncbi:MAG: pyrroline-5-carboxylate reductase [SAR324 cluster bacterium]|nr:pyrroline-5-carboxylate reductase [SAR324 cluster bacterium]